MGFFQKNERGGDKIKALGTKLSCEITPYIRIRTQAAIRRLLPITDLLGEAPFERGTSFRLQLF